MFASDKRSLVIDDAANGHHFIAGRIDIASLIVNGQVRSFSTSNARPIVFMRGKGVVGSIVYDQIQLCPGLQLRAVGCLGAVFGGGAVGDDVERNGMGYMHPG